MNPIRALAAIALSIAVVSSALAQTLTSSKLVGEWRSPVPENMGQMYAVRDFIFTSTQWAMFFKAYADADAKNPLFTLRVEGPYLLGLPSARVQGATEATFQYTQRFVIADSDAGIAMFKQMGCELKTGVETDISRTGCGFLPSILSSGVEYDLLKLDGERLYFGDRSGDLSKARPEKLSVLSVSRR